MQTDLAYRRLNTPSLDLVADLGTRPNSGPVRLRSNGRRHRPVGSYFSVKSGRMLPWESRNELHDLWHAEVNTDVVGSSVQPHTLRIARSGATSHFTPDRLDQLANGGIRITEIKDSIKTADADYHQKLELARLVYKAQGWSFVLVQKAEIEAEPLFSAVEQIQAYRSTAVHASDLLGLQTLFSSKNTLPLAKVQSFFASGPAGFAICCALIVRRVLSPDLCAGLGEQTPVSLVARRG